MFQNVCKLFKMVEFFTDVCCICLETKESLTNLCVKDANKTAYYDKLKSFLPNLGWSKKFSICDVCAGKLDAAFDFVKTCTESEATRKDNLPLTEALGIDLVKNESEEDCVKNESESFKCDICHKQFKQSKSLKSHVTKIHKETTKQEEILEESDNKKEEESSLKEETKNVDDLDDVFKDFVDFDSPDNYDDSDFELDEKPLKKEAKERKPRVKREKKINEKKERKPRTKIKLPVKCEYCGKDFNRKQHLLAHIRCIHTFEKPYSCDQCDAKFSLSHSLLVHKRRHNDDRRYVCTYCGKKFLCSTDLVHHNKIHLNKREYKCEPCNKSFNTISVLQIHKKCVHTDPELWKHICSYCNRKFPIKSSLTAHLRRHTGEKNFQCKICGKCFYDKKMVENHYRSHSDERLFKCHLCEKDYKDRGGLNLHLKKVHDVGNATIPPPPPKKFGCHLCPKAFSSRGKLQKHICTHTGEKMFNCHLCDKKFNDGWYKRVHLQRKHNVTAVDEDTKNGANVNVASILQVNIMPGSIHVPCTIIQTNHMQNSDHLQGNIEHSPLQPVPLHQHSPLPTQGVPQGSIQSPLQQANLQLMQHQAVSSGHPSPYN